MANRKQSFAPGEFYHLYNRGNSKQVIYRDEADRHRFLQLLYLANSTGSFKVRHYEYERNKYRIPRDEPLVAIGAYCLMPNHFHILLTQPENGDVSKFMQKLITSYSMYFNKKYDRIGALFEGKFKSQYVDSDEYLRYLFSYIHLNPVKLIDPHWKEQGIQDEEAAAQYLASYPFSSYIDYQTFHTGPTCAARNQAAILTPDVFPNYFSTLKEFESHIFDWFKRSDYRTQVGPV